MARLPRCGAALLAGALALAPAFAKDKPRMRHYSGEFHGYWVRVHDRPDPGTGRVMREVTLTAKDDVEPYSLYGLQDGGGQGYRLGIVRYDRSGTGGCTWNATGAAQGIERCTQEQIAQYTRQLDHAIDDVVR